MADSPTTLDQILDSVARVVPADLYSILEFEEGDVLRVRAAHGRLASPR
ncbi:MAG: hypothetical protein HC882_09275, partial [Acidobacteria bacterium]|nr:hypothetical protein [Acidobacteriota bacterium]